MNALQHRCGLASIFVGLAAAFLLLLVPGCKKSDSDYYVLPAAPVVGSITANDGAVALTWAVVPGAQSYNVYWSTSPGVTKTTGTKIEGIAEVSYVHTGLTNAETYYYVITAVGALGESAESGQRSITLPPDSVGVISAMGGDGFAELSWTEVDGATGYVIYRSETPNFDLDSATVIAGATSPFKDTNVTNGTTYYYVVRAVGDGGEGLPSTQVSVQPAQTVGAPVDVTVTFAEEMPNTLVISWEPPPSETPDSYNIYWDTEPGVEIGSNPILGAESPYYHGGLIGGTTYYYIVTAVTKSSESEPSVEVSGVPKGSRNPHGGGGEEGYGNNLSVPVIFADGYGLAGLKIDGTVEPWLDFNTGLRPTSSEQLDAFPRFAPDTIFRLNGIDYYQQKTESTWQAEWLDGSSMPQDVTIDWGDNLVSRKKLTADSVIRVETVLYQDTSETAPADTMTAYNMSSLFGSKRNEMQGTDVTTYESNERTVYPSTGRLTIQKLDGPGGKVDPTVEGFDAAVYERFGQDGPGYYGAEVNVAGRCILGYVWTLRQWDLTNEQKTGWWRITFSLDDQVTFGEPPVKVQNNTFLKALDPSDTNAVLDVANNRCWMEVQIQ